MNSCNPFLKAMAATLTLTFFLIPMGFTAGAEPFSPIPQITTSDMPVIDQKAQQKKKAKKIAASGIVDMVEKTKMGKKFDRFRKDMIHRYTFAYTKDWEMEPPPSSPLPGPFSPKRTKEEFRGVSFSGKFNDHLAPVVEFNSRSNSFNIFSHFHVLHHELDCEISSPPINRIMGVKTGIGFTSDGSKTKAVIKIKFEF